MANREELALIRGARAGRVDAQLELGKLYLFGSAGLPKSLPTALHWLDRAARQDSLEACELIGMHIPLDVASQSTLQLADWYERAYDAGVARAGLVLAQLVLNGNAAGDSGNSGRRSKALGALENAAKSGQAEAQWLLARVRAAAANAPAAPAATRVAPPRPVSAPAVPAAPPPRVVRAAGAVLALADIAALEPAWQAAQWPTYLQGALPLARTLVAALDAGSKLTLRPSPDEVTLLSRCARLLDGGRDVAGMHAAASATPEELRRFWEIAAAEHDRYGQMAMGLWYARMQVDGRRIAGGAGSANFKKAIRWLTQAGEQGMAEAWYALSRIYIKPEFSQRNVADAQRYLERAAEMGYREAQLECGNSAWRARRENESNDVRAVYWLQKAAAQGSREALATLDKIAPRGQGPAYCWGDGLSLNRNVAASHPLLAARLELAAVFRLTRAEALLLDIKSADQGHCLVVDIRASYGRSKRRLVAISSAHERQLLDRVGKLFDDVDCGPNGPEGNYRQRLYRLKTLVPEIATGDEHEHEAFELAA